METKPINSQKQKLDKQTASELDSSSKYKIQKLSFSVSIVFFYINDGFIYH